MSRIQTKLARMAEQGRKALIPFVTAGDPAPHLVLPLMHALVRGGADIIELGVPFSDPMAEGPVIQRASERALGHGVTLHDVLGWVREFRQDDNDTPVVLMGYANPIERIGQQAFVDAAANAGVDGVIVVDYPPEECEEFARMLQARDMDPIFLLAPTSTEERIIQVARVSSGYSYYVSLKGVTGSGNIDVADVARRLEAIKRHVKLPIGVGFGIRDGATARAVAAVADAVVIGSRIIQEMEGVSQDQAVAAAENFLKDIRHALDAPAAA